MHESAERLFVIDAASYSYGNLYTGNPPTRVTDYSQFISRHCEIP